MKYETPHKWYIRQREKGWHKWFAWYPVEVDSETEVWLQWVEREITGMENGSMTSTATYNYRLINPTL